MTQNFFSNGIEAKFWSIFHWQQAVRQEINEKKSREFVVGVIFCQQYRQNYFSG